MGVLEVQDLRVSFGSTEVVRGVSFSVAAGQTLGIVGESGCGKSMTGFACMGMVPQPGKIAGSIRLDGKELVGQNESQWRQVRGGQIALVMQDPFASLNPVMRVGDQVAEALVLHRSMTRRQALDEAVNLLKAVGVPDPKTAARKYPHQLSGGQRQRVVIATAFACRPKVLIADEPTTALDVTLQAQILRLIEDLQAEEQTAVVLISHDIGVVASISDSVAVFYAGKVAEYGETRAVLQQPQHPYTQALLRAMPNPVSERLESIPGQPPRFEALSPGCAFAPRCPHAMQVCHEQPRLEQVGQQLAACWYALGKDAVGL